MLEKLEGINSVPFLLLRSEALCLHPEATKADLEQSQKDVSKAIEFDPGNPNVSSSCSWLISIILAEPRLSLFETLSTTRSQCRLVLGQYHQAMAYRAFNHGKSICRGIGHSSALGRLHGLQIASSMVLQSSSRNSFDPLFLPKDIFQIVFNLLDAHHRVKCLRVSKDWKRGLSDEPNLWRKLDLIHKSEKWDSLSSSIRLFSLNSINSLTEISIEFVSWKEGHQDEVTKSFASLNNSSSSLKRIKFSGLLINACAIVEALRLASNCANLESFEYLAIEDVYPAEEEAMGPHQDLYRDARRQKLAELQQGELRLDELRFKKYPSKISLVFSPHVEIQWGSARFFSKAQNIDMETGLTLYSQHTCLLQADVVKILRSSRESLRSLTLKEKYFVVTDSEGLISGTQKDPILLPNLRQLQAKYLEADAYGGLSASSPSINIVAPLLTPEKSIVNIPNFISIQGELIYQKNDPAPRSYW